MDSRELFRRVNALSADVDAARWKLAKLAAQAKAQAHKIPDWAAIIGVTCRRATRTVRGWAATWEWVDQAEGEAGWLEWLPYSFYENAARYRDRLDDETLVSLLSDFYAESGATLEEFRAELATLAGAEPAPVGAAEFRRIRETLLGWFDGAPPKAQPHIRTAADALEKAINVVSEVPDPEAEAELGSA